MVERLGEVNEETQVNEGGGEMVNWLIEVDSQSEMGK